jgi:hypothetical protein
LNIRNLTTSQVIGSKDRGYSSTDHGRQSTAHLTGLQTLSYLVNGRKADNQKDYKHESRQPKLPAFLITTLFNLKVIGSQIDCHSFF